MGGACVIHRIPRPIAQQTDILPTWTVLVYHIIDTNMPRFCIQLRHTTHSKSYTVPVLSPTLVMFAPSWGLQTFLHKNAIR